MRQALVELTKTFSSERRRFFIGACLAGAFFLYLLVLVPQAAWAQAPAPDVAPSFGLNEDFGVAVGQDTDLKSQIARVINIILGFLGIIAVILILYAGFLYLTARGNEDQVKKAKLILRNALIGLVIIFAAWGITAFIINQLRGATSPGAGDGSDNGGGVGGGLPAERFTLEEFQTSHAGRTNRDDVFRCSNIQTRFNHWVDLASVASSTGFKAIQKEDAVGRRIDSLLAVAVDARNNALVLERRNNDDQAKTDKWPAHSQIEIQVPKALSDSDSKPLVDCTALGCNDNGTYYSWQFSTTDKEDLKPPALTSSYPPLASDRAVYPDRNVARSITFALNFSEVIDVRSVTGPDNLLIADNIKVEQIKSSTDQAVVAAIPSSHFDASVSTAGVRFALNKTHRSAQDNGPYLEPFAWYRVTVKNIKDLCNNVLESTGGGTVTFIFQTNGDIPGVAFTYPSDKYEFACPNTEAFVQFKTSMYDVKRSSCAVNPANGGLVLAGSGVGGRNLVVSDNIPPSQEGAVINTNNFCKRYEFADTTRELAPNTTVRPVVDYRNPANDAQTDKASWSFSVKPANECANAPYISRISPGEGPWGRCVTISGRYFGQSADRGAGDAALHLNLESSRNAIPVGSAGERLRGNWARAYREGQGFAFAINNANWFDTYLTGLVPNVKAYQDAQEGVSPISLLPSGTDGAADFQINVKRAVTLGGTAQTLISNSAPFVVRLNEPAYQGPCLSSISPSSGAWGANVSLAGINFGSAPGAITFTDRAFPAAAASWASTAISTAVPSQSQDGLVHVEAAGKISNGLPFDVAAGAGGSCNLDANCAPGLVCRNNQCINPPSSALRPSGFRVEDAWPKAQCANTCTNAALGFVTNLDINRGSVNGAVYQAVAGRIGGSIAVLRCKDKSCKDFISPTSEIVEPTLDEDNKRVSLAMAFLPNTSYRVIIYSDANGLRSATGTNLVNNNYDSNNDGRLDAYSWYFSVGGSVCALSRLDLNKNSLGLYEGTSSNLEARGYSRVDSCSPADGQLLKPESLGALNWFARPYANGNIQDECSSTGAPPQLEGKNILTINNSNQPHINVVSAVSGTTAGTPALACVSGAGDTIKTASTVTVFARCREDSDCVAGGHCPHSSCNRTTGRCSPVINDAYPQSGAVGTWVTVRGCYFGNAPGAVSGARSNAVFDIPLAFCGQYWTNNSIIAEVPPGLQAVEPIKVTKNTSEGGESATWSQQYTTDQTDHPALCRLLPTYGRAGAEVGLYGKNFGSRNAATDKVWFFGTSTPERFEVVDIKEWTDTAASTVIKAVVPVVSRLGDWAVRVAKGIPQSNPINFNVTAGAGPGAGSGPIESLSVQSYTPGAGNRACLAMIAEVVLNGTVDSQTLNNNFYVRLSGATAPLSGQVNAFNNGQSGTRLAFAPKLAMASSTAYEIVLKSGNSGLRSTTGGTLSADGIFCKSNQAFAQGECVIGFSTIAAGDKAAEAQCQASRLTVEPANPVYFCAGKDGCENDSDTGLAGNQRVFEARLAARNGQSLTANAPFAWAVGASTPAVVAIIPKADDAIKQTQTLTILPKAGESIVSAMADINNKEFKAATTVRVLPCENPWPSYPRAPYVDSDTNFSMLYCRDKGEAGIDGDLPDVPLEKIIQINDAGLDNKGNSHSLVPGLIKELFFTVDRADSRNTDAIGIRVIKNDEHDSVSEWYSRQLFNKGTPQAITVDGYKALRDGRTVYVAAPNDKDGDGVATGKIYTNIYLLSVSDGATVETQDIFNQLLANWRFAANVIDPDNRDALRRDTTRLSDLRLMADILETRSTLPSLVSGSYLPNLSTSVWPSWKGALAADLGKALPVDPVNDAVCRADYDQTTCYGKDSDPKFECENTSHIYQYKYANAERDFTISANLEYQASSWAHPAQSRWRAGGSDDCVNTHYGQ